MALASVGCFAEKVSSVFEVGQLPATRFQDMLDDLGVADNARDIRRRPQRVYCMMPEEFEMRTKSLRLKYPDLFEDDDSWNRASEAGPAERPQRMYCMMPEELEMHVKSLRLMYPDLFEDHDSEDEAWEAGAVETGSCPQRAYCMMPEELEMCIKSLRLEYPDLFENDESEDEGQVTGSGLPTSQASQKLGDEDPGNSEGSITTNALYPNAPIDDQ
eukprot:TRINITY_DN6221_c0_g2_i2.p1 TRINITY_DN6221_c0_g2~~TRINITY_DN6221_c0_g2_i2.p1  ORF type:complete len:216 (-),score=42.87 TRINITY_DN6221_c0_g2_i2:492-1139(-)